MAKWWESLDKLFGGGPGGRNRVSTFRWLLVAAGVGAAIMILTSLMTVENVQPYGEIPSSTESGPPPSEDVPAFRSGSGKDSTFAMYESMYEEELKEILQKIVGVGNVDVMVTLESTEEIIAERNMTESEQQTTERDANGANRLITQTSRSGEIVLYTENGSQKPLVRKTIKPVIRGVFIVAAGAENATVKKLLIEAVERGLGVPPHKISIAPSKR